MNKNIIHYMIGRIVKHDVDFIIEIVPTKYNEVEKDFGSCYANVVEGEDCVLYGTVRYAHNDELNLSPMLDYYDEILTETFSNNKISINRDDLSYKSLVKKLFNNLNTIKFKSKDLTIIVHEIFCCVNNTRLIRTIEYYVVEFNTNMLIIKDEYDEEEVIYKED